MSRRPVHLPGEGFLTGDGRFYSDSEVREALLSLCEWWVGLSAEERSGLLEAAELAQIDPRSRCRRVGVGDMTLDVDVSPGVSTPHR